MFLELHVDALRREQLSWILCKHPQHTFELKLGGGRVVRGQWLEAPTGVELDVTGGAAYQLTVDMIQDDNGVAFLQEMRKRNKPFYVNACQSAVAPYTVVCMRHALKNALAGKHGPEASAYGATAVSCRAVFGPWTVPVPAIAQFMKALDLNVCVAGAVPPTKPGAVHEPADTKMDDNDVLLSSASVVCVSSATDMTVTHFLQRLYVGATLLTHKQHVGDRWEWQQKLDSLALYTTGWQHLLAALPPWAQRLISHSQLTQEQLEDQKLDRQPRNEAKASMHERRHEWIINTIVGLQPEPRISNPTPVLTIIDYGCSSGKLSRQLLTAFPHGGKASDLRLYAVDVTREEVATRIWRHRSLARATFVRSNLLYPVKLLEQLIHDSDQTRATTNHQKPEIDVLVLTEVIEHLEPNGRAALVSIIADTLRPKCILVTTPNWAYNVHIPKLCANGFRHSDHRIEFDQADWQREVVTPICQAGYGYKPANLWPDKECEPSFCGQFTLLSDSLTTSTAGTERWRKAHRHMLDTIFKPVTIPDMQEHVIVATRSDAAKAPAANKARAKISSSTLAAGVMTPEFVTCADSVFFRAPTLAPVEHHVGEPDFLEHPLGAYDYYQKRGIKALWAEHKYMGSRAHMLVFVNQDAATRAAWPGGLLTIISRSGRDFFSPDGAFNPGLSTMPPAWQPCLQGRLAEQRLDFAILDAEILPWSVKAGKLIEQEFRQPGQCALVSRRRLFGAESDKTQRAQLFMDALACYTQEADGHADIRARVFNVIACGHVRGVSDKAPIGTPKFTNIRHGDELPAPERYALIDAMCRGGESVGILPVERMFVDLTDQASMRACTQAWLRYTSLPDKSASLPDDPVGVGKDREGRQAPVGNGTVGPDTVPDLGGEGMVFKTHPTLRERHNDALVQPALKVRGRDYLRLIYGIDYLMPECFAIVKHRRVAVKRLLALKQTLLGRMILNAFLSGDTLECMRCQAAFCGEGHCCTVDATL